MNKGLFYIFTYMSTGVKYILSVQKTAVCLLITARGQVFNENRKTVEKSVLVVITNLSLIVDPNCT